MIDVKNLTKVYTAEKGVFKACENISFHVNKGEIYGIIGLSGAGKSTLVRCLNRLEEPTEGSIRIDGVDITALDKKALRKERQDIGMIFQSFNLFHQKTVYENIAFPMRIAGWEKEKIKERVETLLDFIDLKAKAKSYPRALSGGQKQRVAIARALALSPKVLLSDEGTSALDPANTKSILRLLRKAVDEFGMTIILITHQMEVAKDICDRIAVMENGHIVEENKVEELFRRPKHRITKAFIQSLEDMTQEEIHNPEDFKGTLVRISYDEKSAKEPVLSQLIRTTKVDINILSGNISKLHDTSVGYMIIEMLGPKEEIAAACEKFQHQGIVVEVIG